MYWPDLNDAAVRNIISQSINCGINWFDTAEFYGWGASENALARNLRKLGITPGDVIIASKWWPLLRSAKSVFTTIHKRLEALEGYPLSLYQIHKPWSRSPLTAQMQAMAKLILVGKIKYAGISNFSAKSMEKCHAVLQKYQARLISNQVSYSLLNRKIEKNGVLDLAKKLNISIIAYSPLEQGILSGKFHDDPGKIKQIYGIRKYMPGYWVSKLKKSKPLIEILKNIAQKYSAAPAQVALSWVLNFHGNTVVAIAGATSAEQAKVNAEALHLHLSEEELHQLDEVSAAIK
jgi:aryl-alcohol dehydrogenase-like predicted oxidoreductase